MEKTANKKFFSYVSLTIGFVFKENKLYILVSTVAISILGVLPAAVIKISQNLINCIQSGLSDHGKLGLYIGVLCVLKVSQSLITECYSFYNAKVTLELSKKFNMSILEKASKINLGDFDNPQFYDVISRAQNQDAAQIISFINEITSLIKELITIISTITVLIMFEWWLIIICVMSPVVKSIIAIKIDKKWFQIKLERTSTERQCWYIKYLFTTGTGIREIRLFNFHKELIDKYKILQSQIISQDVSVIKKSSILAFVSELVSIVAFVFSIGFVSFKAIYKKVLLGDVVAFIESIETMSESTEAIFGGFENIVNNSLYMELLIEYLDLEEEEQGELIIDNIKSIELRNVSFSYKNGMEILKNINLSLHEGDYVKLVGGNGSGKTTLINIIMGIYDDYGGNIYINGVDLKKINKASYFNCISCVFQNFQKFETSIKNNISLLRDDINEESIISKLKKVELCDKIYEMGGIDVVVGSWFGQYQLSIGEWQRIAIARAMVMNRDVLILDEATSSLDKNSKNDIINRIKENQGKRIIIEISHSERNDKAIYTHIYKLKKRTLDRIY